MIDWWLLVSLNILVITMLFHTFLASKVAKLQKKPMRLLSAKSVFNYKQKDSSVGSGPGITNVESRGDGEASRQGTVFYCVSNSSEKHQIDHLT